MVEGSSSSDFDVPCLDDLAAQTEAEAASNSAQDPASGAGNDAQALRAAAISFLAEATQIESVALELDRAGDHEQAIACYRQEVERLSSAASACVDGSPDRAVLSRRAGEVLGRVIYLESLCGSPASVPPEEHICQIELVLGDDGIGKRPSSTAKTWRKQAASAAAIGGAAGLLVLHGPLAAAVVAGGTAYAASRDDGAGKAARAVGDMGLKAASRAKTFADEKQLPLHMEVAVEKARAIDERFAVSERAQAAAVSSWQTFREFDRKHKVGSKVSHG
eukprot:CAMPEP_0170577346 /NCGR_PEP_ID=MMETSP0224-20130122/4877_1 /TAXON_ID=285029 /ORGANISM="Togula jolla, Strain CCCM 725" /LENGTH=276 /DNA_ID=CAMNT_0010900249 /DNA_START=77 /DNA_END=903 /DNA_ORIENTATION=+